MSGYIAYLKEYFARSAFWITFSLGLLVVLLFTNRPVKVSVSDSIFVDFGIQEAEIAVEERVDEGPPARYLATFVLENGKKVYVSTEGSCRVVE